MKNTKISVGFLDLLISLHEFIPAFQQICSESSQPCHEQWVLEQAGPLDSAF